MPIMQTVIQGGSQPVLQTLSVTPTTSSQTITPTTGVDGFDVSAVTSSIDANITAGNIKKDVQILGVTGTYEGTAPTGTISITSNGTHDVTNYASANVNVSATASDSFLAHTTNSSGEITGVQFVNMDGPTKIVTSGLYNAYKGLTCTGTVGSTTIRNIGQYGMENCFQGCTGITSASFNAISSLYYVGSTFSSTFKGCTSLQSVSFSALEEIIGDADFADAFNGCTALTSVNFNSLYQIGLHYNFLRAFRNCRTLPSISFPSLERIEGNEQNFGTAFEGCSALTQASFSMLRKISSSKSFYEAFKNCTSLTTVIIGNTTQIDFGDYSNQFTNMFNGCSQNISVTAPAASQSTIQSMSGYPNFGGTGTVTWNWR